MNFKTAKKKATDLVSRLKQARDERTETEQKLADLAVLEHDIENEITEEMHQIGLEVYKAKVEEDAGPIVAECDAIHAEMEVLIVQYIDKYRELLTAEAKKALLLRELRGIREEYELWPKEAPLPELGARLQFSFSGKTGEPYISVRNKEVAAGYFLRGHLNAVLNKLRQKGKRKHDIDDD